MNRTLTFTAGSGISVDGDRLSIGVEVENIPVSPSDGANIGVMSCPLPIDKFDYLCLHSSSLKLRPSPDTKGVVEALFRIHLGPDKDVTGACPVFSAILSTITVPQTQTPSCNYYLPLRPTDKFLIVEIQEAGGVGKVDVEMQVVGRFTGQHV